MRLILYIRSLCNAVYNVEYNHFFQALIYDLLKDTIFDRLHTKGGYKFFCFSNIFPIGDLKVRDIRNIIISSPSVDFINVLCEKLNSTDTVKIGGMLFEIIKVVRFSPRISNNSIRLITGTPIILRISRKKAEEYGLLLKNFYDYVYWRFNMPLKIFLEQLEANIIKKWREYYGQLPPEHSIPLFNSSQLILEPLKEVSTRVHYKTGTQIVVGTTWKFWFRNLEKSQLRLLTFGIETGLGEMNAQGFGFINIEK
ncbi:MAG: CRISPR-associated endoribonuclease Cas6 [Nitrososphaerota archaeon]